MTEFEMLNYFRNLIKRFFNRSKYIETRTKEGNPFDIRAHMLKDRNHYGVVQIFILE